MFLEESGSGFRPRVLEVLLPQEGPNTGQTEDLALGVRTGAWSCEDPLLERIGSLGGSALALATSLNRARAGELPYSFLCSVGCAVRLGLPTASRATVAGIAPLTESYVESQVGGGFAERLVANFDALAISGTMTPGQGRVLVIQINGQARLDRWSELSGLDLFERLAFLREHYPQTSGLCVGPAAEQGVRYASLATLEDPPSFTGRGGLGERLGRSGLCAVLVEGGELREMAAEGPLAEFLATSPHLRARGRGGTFELHEAFAARGDLPVKLASGDRFAETLSQRESCPGCPTACRHILRKGERRLTGRFSATFPLGQALGLESVEDELALLEACNRVGVDSVEMGGCLALLVAQSAEGETSLHGNVQGLVQHIESVGEGPCAQGVLALHASLGGTAPIVMHGSAARPTSDLGALLGQWVSARGSDPMRAFPFLSESGAGAERLRELFDPLELPAGSFDSKCPAGKGRLIWWHENLANAVDVSGFCAFSFAGLVGDGLANLDDMARWLEIPGLVPSGDALLALGSSLSLLQRELAGRLASPHSSRSPGWARAALEQPGMWDEYCLLRGLDREGVAKESALARVGSIELARPGVGELSQLFPTPGAASAEPATGAIDETLEFEPLPGSVTLHASGLLGQHLGQRRSFDSKLPCTLECLLRELAAAFPSAAPWLWWRDGGVASVYRDGQRLAVTDLLSNGDRLDLVVAISGG